MVNFNEMFEYVNGHLFWKKTNSRKFKIGDRAGSVVTDGDERKIYINKKPILEKRIIYTMFHGEIPDGYNVYRYNNDRTDNRIENLYLKKKPAAVRNYVLTRDLIDKYLYIENSVVYRKFNNKETSKILKRGYYQIRVGPGYKYKPKRFFMHHIVWIWYNGPIPDGYEIDHINRDKLDNRIENLRCVKKHVNLSNNNSKGYSYCKKSNRWICRVTRNGNTIRTATKNEEDAKRWVKETRDSLDI